MSRLIVIASAEGDRAAPISDKTLSGMQCYMARWPGEVCLVTANSGGGQTNNGGPTPDVQSMEVITSEDPIGEGLKLSRRGDVIVSLLKPDRLGLLRSPGSVVFYVENPLSVRIRQTITSYSPSSLNRARIVLGAIRHENAFKRAARHAAGLQCNGWPSFVRYRRSNARSLLFFDSRVTSEQIEDAQQIQREWVTAGIIRLGFSGRLHPIKGPDHAVRLVEVLTQRSVPCTLTIFGSGPMEEELRFRSKGLPVTFVGNVDFATEWVHRIPREIDLMVLPHLQGDPSCTYLEAAGLGVPIVGYDNPALASLSRHAGIGNIVPMKNVERMADVAQALGQNPEMLPRSADPGVAFMRQHDMNSEFDRRVQHLIESC